MFEISRICELPIWHVTGKVEHVGIGFLRMQEHYESSKFQGEIFTLDEYEEWYTETYGDFTYYKDYRGFNVPSSVVRTVHRWFPGHSIEEMEIFDLLVAHQVFCGGDFYLIGSPRHAARILQHEICHALYYLHNEYRTKAERVIARYDLRPLREFLMEREYAPSVIDDEIQAYALSGWLTGVPDTREMRLFRRELKSTLRPLLPFKV